MTANLALGMNARSAAAAAGYAPTTIHATLHRITRNLVDSAFTRAVDRGLAKRQKEFDSIIDPYLDGLDAPVIVKSQTEGIAMIGKDPETQAVLPDFDIRLKSADRLVGLFGGVPKDSEMPTPPSPGLTVIISQDGGEVQVNQQTNVRIDRTTIQPTGEVSEDAMPVVLIEEEGK